MAFRPTPEQSAVLVSIADRLGEPASASFDLREYRYSDGSIPVAFAPWRHTDDTGVHWVATLTPGRIFLMVCDGEPEALGELLAQVVRFEMDEGIELEPGHTLKNEHHYLTSNGWAAVCILNPDDIPEFPEGDQAGGSELMWVLAITAEEYALKRESGLLAMFDMIEGTRRSVFAFRKPPN